MVHYIFMKFNDKMIIELHEYLSFHFVSCRCCGSKQSFENDDSFHGWSVLYSCRLMNFVVPFGHRLILITDEIKVNGDAFMDESRNRSKILDLVSLDGIKRFGIKLQNSYVELGFCNNGCIMNNRLLNLSAHISNL